MNHTSSIRNWTEIRGLPIVALDTTLKLGTVEDFYFEPDTNAVRALRVNRGVLGHRAVPANWINTIEPTRITVMNEEMVIEEEHDGRLPELPLGHSLLSYKVVSENGETIGTVSNILLDTQPPIALRVAAYEVIIERGRRSRQKVFSADEVTDYGEDTIYILDQVAKALR